MNQAFVDTVRGTGGGNALCFLLIAGYGTNFAQTFGSRFKMPVDTADKKLVVSVHYFFRVTGQNAHITRRLASYAFFSFFNSLSYHETSLVSLNQ